MDKTIVPREGKIRVRKPRIAYLKDVSGCSLPGYFFNDFDFSIFENLHTFESTFSWQDFDLIFLEDSLSWLDLLMFIQEFSSYKSIILLTAELESHFLAKAYQAGVSDVLVMPAEAKEIPKVVKLLS